MRIIINLKAENVTKIFGKIIALDNINFYIEGEIIAIVGPNGSGKSTLLSIIAGLRHPTKGRLFLNNVEPYRRREEVLSKIAFSFEKPRFNVGIRVKDIIDIARSICRDHDKFLSYAENLGLLKLGSRRLYELSSGQSQLLSLVLTLFCDTNSIAILDEPLAHLDIKYQGIFLDSINSRKNVVFTTHVLEEAEIIADKIIVLDNGKIKWVGSTEEIYSENIYEIIIPREAIRRIRDLLREHGGRIIADFGSYILIKGISEEEISMLFEKRIIIGYRRAGLRVKIYE